MGALHDVVANANDVQVVNVAVCEHDAEGAPFYCFCRDFVKMFPDASKYCSLEKAWLINRIKVGGVWNLSIAEPEILVEHVSVRCATPATLLGEIGSDPADVDVLIVDA